MVNYTERVVQLLKESNGDKDWYLNGKRHREKDQQLKLGYLNGKRHKAWYINGRNYTERMAQQLNGRMVIVAWFLNGKRHREDGPAIESIQMVINLGT